jgi:hypothetical protein
VSLTVLLDILSFNRAPTVLFAYALKHRQQNLKTSLSMLSEAISPEWFTPRGETFMKVLLEWEKEILGQNSFPNVYALLTAECVNNKVQRKYQTMQHLVYCYSRSC